MFLRIAVIGFVLCSRLCSRPASYAVLGSIASIVSFGYGFVTARVRWILGGFVGWVWILGYGSISSSFTLVTLLYCLYL